MLQRLNFRNGQDRTRTCAGLAPRPLSTRLQSPLCHLPPQRARRDSNSRRLAASTMLPTWPVSRYETRPYIGGRRRHRTSHPRGAACFRDRLQSRLVIVRKTRKDGVRFELTEGRSPLCGSSAAQSPALPTVRIPTAHLRPRRESNSRCLVDNQVSSPLNDGGKRNTLNRNRTCIPTLEA